MTEKFDWHRMNSFFIPTEKLLRSILFCISHKFHSTRIRNGNWDEWIKCGFVWLLCIYVGLVELLSTCLLFACKHCSLYILGHEPEPTIACTSRGSNRGLFASDKRQLSLHQESWACVIMLIVFSFAILNVKVLEAYCFVTLKCCNVYKQINKAYVFYSQHSCADDVYLILNWCCSINLQLTIFRYLV